MVLPSYVFPAQDRSTEIKRMFADKDAVDITVDGKHGLKNLDYSYYVSSGVLYEISSSTYAVALKDIDFPRATTGKETVETLSSTGNPVFYLILRLLDGRKVYRTEENEPPLPARDVLILFFPDKAMADQALVYLKQIAEESKTKDSAGIPPDVSASSAAIRGEARKEIKPGKRIKKSDTGHSAGKDGPK